MPHSQAEILQELIEQVAETIKNNPDEWVKVKDVAYLYAKIRNEIRAKRAENSVLLPLGIKREHFASKKNGLEEKFIKLITSELLNYEVPKVSVIISGIDTKAHIYVVEDDDVSCWDTIGYAAIGIGARHATSQLMLGGQHLDTELSESLLLTYIAKKDQKSHQGLVKKTDMFSIGSDPGTYAPLEDRHMKKLASIYKNLSDQEQKSF